MTLASFPRLATLLILLRHLRNYNDVTSYQRQLVDAESVLTQCRIGFIHEILLKSNRLSHLLKRAHQKNFSQHKNCLAKQHIVSFPSTNMPFFPPNRPIGHQIYFGAGPDSDFYMRKALPMPELAAESFTAWDACLRVLYAIKCN